MVVGTRRMLFFITSRTWVLMFTQDRIRGFGPMLQVLKTTPSVKGVVELKKKILPRQMMVWPVHLQVADRGGRAAGGGQERGGRVSLENLQPWVCISGWFDIWHYLVWEFLRQEISTGNIPKCVVSLGCPGNLLHLLDWVLFLPVTKKVLKDYCVSTLHAETH